MEMSANVSDAFGKSVGRRVPPEDAMNTRDSSKDSARRWSEALGNRRIPKGVYRFRSHEEANEWLWKTIATPKTD